MDIELSEMIDRIREIASDFFGIGFGETSKDSHVVLNLVEESPKYSQCESPIAVVGEFVSLLEDELGILNGSLDSDLHLMLFGYGKLQATLENISKAAKKQLDWQTCYS